MFEATNDLRWSISTRQRTHDHGVSPDQSGVKSSSFTDVQRQRYISALQCRVRKGIFPNTHIENGTQTSWNNLLDTLL